MSEAKRRTNLPVYDEGAVRFATTGQFLTLFNKSLHRGAVAVYHDAHLEPLQPFDVELQIPGAEWPIPAEVQVVSARPGMYLFQLLDPNGDVASALNEHASELKNQLTNDLLSFMGEPDTPPAPAPAPQPTPGVRRAATDDIGLDALSFEPGPAQDAPAAAPGGASLADSIDFSLDDDLPLAADAGSAPLDFSLDDDAPPAPAAAPAVSAAPATAPTAPMPSAAVPVATDEEDEDAAAPPPPPPVGDIAEIVGIDFGQSYTGASVGINDGVYMVPDAKGRRLFPTVISYPKKGTPLASWAARKRLASHPNETVSSIKRLLGRSFSDPHIAGHLHGLPFRSKAGPNDSILLTIDDAQYAIPQICADILRYLRSSLSERLGRPVTKAVFTHPVAFTDEQKEALKRAAQMAGFEVMQLLEEPVAVALAYGFGQGKNEIVAVYDFGGGTFDFTILDISVDSERVLASKGDAWLGGDDFDLVMAQAVANKFWRDTQVELQNDAVEWQRLLHACESAKQHLSQFEEIRLQLKEVVRTPEPIDLIQNMRRPGFELIAANLFEQTLEICQAAMDSIGFEPRDITQLVVSGGTARIPFIRDGLARFFERQVAEVVHPQQAVALGAGVAAARLAGHGARLAHSS